MSFGSLLQRIGQLPLALILVAGLALAVLVKPRWLTRTLSVLEAMCRRLADWCERRARDILTPKGTWGIHRLEGMPAGERIVHPPEMGAEGETPGQFADADERRLQAEGESVGDGGNGGMWAGAKLLAQLLWGTFAVCLLTAMILIDTGRSCAVQGGGEDCTILLPFGLSFGVVNGVLWAVTLAYFGGIFVEGIGWVADKQLHLYPDLGAKARKLLTIYAGIGVGLALIAVSLMYVVSAMQLQQMQWPEAVLAVAFLQALLINGAAFAAVPSLIGGIGALLALLCIVAALLASLLAQLCLLLRHLMDARELDVPAALSSTATTNSFEFDSQEGGSHMPAESKKTWYALAVGRDAVDFVQQEVRYAREYGGGPVIGGHGGLNPARLDEVPVTPTDGDNLTPLRHEIELAPQMRQDPRQQEQLVVQKMVRNVHDKRAGRRQLRGELFMACDREHVQLAAGPLRSHAIDRTGMRVTLAVIGSRRGTLRLEEIAAADAEVERLLAERVVDSVLAIDPLPLSARHDLEALGERRRKRQFAAALGQVVAASAQHPQQPTPGELLQRICTSHRYCGMSTLTDSVPLGERITFIEPVRRWLGKRAVGYSDVGVMAARVLHLAERAMRDPSVRSVDIPLDGATAPSVLCVTSPLRPSDRRYPEFVSTVEHGVAGLAEGVSTIFVCGSGLPDRKLPEGLYVQVTFLFGFNEPPFGEAACGGALPGGSVKEGDAAEDIVADDSRRSDEVDEGTEHLAHDPGLVLSPPDEADRADDSAGHTGTSARARRRGVTRTRDARPAPEQSTQGPAGYTTDTDLS